MPTALANGIHLYYEVTGSGSPLVLVHEFAGDLRSWDPQVKYFARRYQVITYNARGFLPSDVPEDTEAYSQDTAVQDLRALMVYLGITRAHLCGLSMGGYAVLHFGLQHPEMARSLVVAGVGYGSDELEDFRRDAMEIGRRIERDGMAEIAASYARGPARVQFMNKDPRGWQEFADALTLHSTPGSAGTLRGIQARRPSVYALEESLRQLKVPTLIMSGDEDEPCLQPGLFMKRTIPTAGLLIFPKTGHTINLEEPDAFNRAVLDFLTLVDAERWATRDPRSMSRSALLPGA
jgi:pimeloyl-ACP methyl ester carboxylesterase